MTDQDKIRAFDLLCEHRINLTFRNSGVTSRKHVKGTYHTVKFKQYLDHGHAVLDAIVLAAQTEG